MKKEHRTEHNDEAHRERVLDEPVLDGAEEHPEEQIDPREGMTDPALVRDVETGKKTVNPYG